MVRRLRTGLSAVRHEPSPTDNTHLEVLEATVTVTDDSVVRLEHADLPSKQIDRVIAGSAFR